VPVGIGVAAGRFTGAGGVGC
ncbi:hypothetical protein CP8484711_0552B, partial [Chlamydia psittaci 84-8471/1]